MRAQSMLLIHIISEYIEFGQQHQELKYKVLNWRRIGDHLLEIAYGDTADSVQSIMDRTEK